MDITGEQTLSHIFSDFAAYQPQRTFLIFEDLDGNQQHWTFAQFEVQVNQTAHWLVHMGVKRGDSFTFNGMNAPAFALLALAASRIGAVMVTADYRAKLDELAYVLDHSESKLVVTEPQQLALTREAAGSASNLQHVVLSGCGGGSEHPVFEDETAKQPETHPAIPTLADDVAHMLYTSGTTGRPKGVMLTNRCLIYGAQVFARNSGLRNEDRHLITLPLYHAAAQCHAFWPSIVAGASIVILPRFSPTRFFGLAVRHECTMAALFSSPLRMLLAQPDAPEQQQHKLRNITFAIALTDAQFDEWHHRFGAPLQHLWGMTETTGLPLMSPLYGPRHLNSMGKPVLGYNVRIVDDHLHELPPGTIGQIVVDADPGRNVMKGYFNNPEATQDTLHDGLLFTGDNAYCDEDGFFYFVDRSKELIKRGGDNIAPGEIENVIKQMGGVADVAVVGVPDDMYDEVAKAFVIKADGAGFSEQAVIDHCATRLPKFKVPESVVFRDEFPRTSVGKIQKHLLRDQHANAN